MATASSKTETFIELTVTEEEARYLAAILQNDITNRETDGQRDHRYSIFSALRRVVQE